MPDQETRKSESDPTAALLADTCMRLHIKNRVLERLLHLFSNLGDLARVREEVLNASLDAIPAEAASLISVEPDTGRMMFVSARGPIADRIQGMTMEAGTGIAGACAIEKKVLAISDVSRDPRFAEEITQALGFKTQSLLAAPILWHGDAIGVIEVVNKLGEDTFQWYELELMERVARAAATLFHLAEGRS